MSWTIVAIDASGGVLDVVGPIEVSPGGDSGSGTVESSSAPDEPLTAQDLPDPCTLIDQSAVDDLFGGASPAAEPGNVTGPGNSVAGRSCNWSRGFAVVRVSILIETRFLTPMEICDYCEPIEGLGDEAWAGESDRGSGGALVAVVVGALGVQVSADGLGASVQQVQHLASAVLAGLD
jgi:hypothetical protein